MARSVLLPAECPVSLNQQETDARDRGVATGEPQRRLALASRRAGIALFQAQARGFEVSVARCRFQPQRLFYQRCCLVKLAQQKLQAEARQQGGGLRTAGGPFAPDSFLVQTERRSRLAAAFPGEPQVQHRTRIARIEPARLFECLNCCRKLVLLIEMKPVQEPRIGPVRIYHDGALQSFPRHIISSDRHGEFGLQGKRRRQVGIQTERFVHRVERFLVVLLGE